jgi:hypothetical protein
MLAHARDSSTSVVSVRAAHRAGTPTGGGSRDQGPRGGEARLLLVYGVESQATLTYP